MSNIELSEQAQQQLREAATNLVTHFSGKLQTGRVSQVLGLQDTLNNGLEQDEKSRLFDAINKNPDLIDKLESQIKENPELLDQAKSNPKAALEKMTGVDLDPPKPKAQTVQQSETPAAQKDELSLNTDITKNPRFEDPLGVAGAGLSGKTLIDENDPIFDDSRFDNEFLDQIREDKAGSHTAGNNSQGADHSSDVAAERTTNTESSPEIEADTQDSAIPAEILEAPGFNDFLNNLMTDEAQGGLGLAEEVSGLMAGGAGAAGGAGFIDSLKDQLKENPKLFEDMNGVIEDADASQRAGLKEHFQAVFAAGGKGGDAMDMALADLQQYAQGVGLANSPMGGMLGGLIEKFLPGIMKMLDGFLGSLGIEGGASGLLSSLGFGDSFIDGLTSKGADGAQNLTASQQQVLDGAEAFFEKNGAEIDGFMAGLDGNQASLLAATLDPKADGTLAERVGAFEDSLSGLQKGTWEQWKAEGREIISQDPELANSEFAKMLEASDALPPENKITAAEFGAGLDGAQTVSLSQMINIRGNEDVFNDNYQKFWDSLSPEQQQDWVDLVGEEPNFGEIAQAGQDAVEARNNKIARGPQEKKENTGQAQKQDEKQENDQNRRPKDESELDKDNGIGNDDRHDRVAAYGQDYQEFMKGPVYGASLDPEGRENAFKNSADLGAKGPVKLANGDIVSIGGAKDGARTPEINKPENDPNQQRGYNPALGS